MMAVWFQWLVFFLVVGLVAYVLATGEPRRMNDS